MYAEYELSEDELNAIKSEVWEEGFDAAKCGCTTYTPNPYGEFE